MKTIIAARGSNPMNEDEGFVTICPDGAKVFKKAFATVSDRDPGFMWSSDSVRFGTQYRDWIRVTGIEIPVGGKVEIQMEEFDE